MGAEQQMAALVIGAGQVWMKRRLPPRSRGRCAGTGSCPRPGSGPSGTTVSSCASCKSVPDRVRVLVRTASQRPAGPQPVQRVHRRRMSLTGQDGPDRSRSGSATNRRSLTRHEKSAAGRGRASSQPRAGGGHCPAATVHSRPGVVVGEQRFAPERHSNGRCCRWPAAQPSLPGGRVSVRIQIVQRRDDRRRGLRLGQPPQLAFDASGRTPARTSSTGRSAEPGWPAFAAGPASRRRGWPGPDPARPVFRRRWQALAGAVRGGPGQARVGSSTGPRVGPDGRRGW